MGCKFCKIEKGEGQVKKIKRTRLLDKDVYLEMYLDSINGIMCRIDGFIDAGLVVKYCPMCGKKLEK